MLFGPLPVGDAKGAILGHSVHMAGAVFRKGRVLSATDIDSLHAAGFHEIVVARLEAGDISEDEAAARIATACAGNSIRVGADFTGRANLYATAAGLAVVDTDLVNALNAIDESITVATMPTYSRVAPRQMLATVKIIPFAAPRVHIEAAEHLLKKMPILRVAPFTPRRATLISTVLPNTKASVLDKGRKAVEDRLTSIGSVLVSEQRVAHDAQAVAAAIRAAENADPILILGAGAIVDRRDVIPAAIETAGGTIDSFGMPVDPGNLLLTGRLNGIAVVGLPGCARSPKQNGFDWVLWRIAAGLPVGRKEIATMGVGGLLSEIASRPQLRDAQPHHSRLPQIAAVILAAGLSSRMGSNKLIAEIGGQPLIRRTVETVLASAVDSVVVVTGNQEEEIRLALHGLKVQFRNNPDFPKGLSSSLKCGVHSLDGDCDGALIVLADMPGISTGLIDKLVAAFDPAEDRAICVATRHGKRGNPVLWGRQFFHEIMDLQGDIGAKHLMSGHDDLVYEVEADDDGPLIDIDTPEALAAYRTR